MRELSLREQQLILLDILKYFDGVCRKHNIKYTLCGGTLIGAIRHKGFIPWDDDIDIYITREEYEKFRKVWDNEKHPYYELSCTESWNKITTGRSPQILDKRTVLLDQGERNRPIFMDLFVLDYIEDTAINREILNKYQANLLRYTKYDIQLTNSRLSFNTILSYFWLIYFYIKMMITIKSFSKNNHNDSNTLASTFYIFDGIDKAFIPAEYFNNFIEVDFEGNKFLSIKEYDEHLTFYYGDYMQLPPEKERSPKHTRKSYLL